MIKPSLLTFLLAASAFSPLAAVAPGAPYSLVATVSGTTVTVAWQAPATGDAPTGYIVQAALSPGGAIVATVSVPSSPLIVPNVPNGVYYVRVVAANTDGLSAPSNEAIVVVPGSGAPTPPGCTTRPNAPQDLTASVAGNLVTLNWSAPSGGCPATAFSVHAGSTPGASNLAVANVGGTTAMTASAPDGAYFVRVLASNAFGGSPSSNEVLVTVGASRSSVVVYTNGSDPGLARVTLEDGQRVEYLGAKDAAGLATQLRRYEITQSAGQPASAYEFDASGRPTLLEANGVRTSIVWTSASVGAMTVRSSSGETVLSNVPLRLPAATPIVTPARESEPASAGLTSAGQFVRVRDACSQSVDNAIVHVQATPSIPIPFSTDVFQRYPAVPQGGGLYRAEIPLPDPQAGENLRVKCDTAFSVAASLPCSRILIGTVVVAADTIGAALIVTGVAAGVGVAIIQASTAYGAHMTTACRGAAVIGASCAAQAQGLDRAARDGVYTLEAFARHENETYASTSRVVPVTGPFNEVLPIDVPCNRGPLTGTWRLEYSYGAECGFNSGYEILQLIDDGRGTITGTINGADDRLGSTTGTVRGTRTGDTVHLTRSFATGFVAGATRTFDGVVSGNTMVGRIGTCGSGFMPPATYRRQAPLP